jgi:hypothetical protein
MRATLVATGDISGCCRTPGVCSDLQGSCVGEFIGLQSVRASGASEGAAHRPPQGQKEHRWKQEGQERRQVEELQGEEGQSF